MSLKYFHAFVMAIAALASGLFSAWSTVHLIEGGGWIPFGLHAAAGIAAGGLIIQHTLRFLSRCGGTGFLG